MTLIEIFTVFIDSILEKGIAYILFAIPFFILFWVIGKRHFKSIRIQEMQKATNQHFRHDVLYSISSFFVFAVMDIILLQLNSKGYTLIYSEIDQYGWAWAVFSFILLFLIGDTYFYWSHRIMHQPNLYKFFHRVHHESTDPSPLTAFAFHPSEAILENLMMILLPFIIPLHLGVILTFQLIDMLNNVLGHLGYEVYPSGWVRWPVLKHKTTSTHHNMHHQLFNWNYALYFTWWDKWMKTEFSDYEARHAEIFERKHINKSEDGYYLLTVSDRIEEANDAFTIKFGNVPYIFRDFLPGQHLTVRVNIDGQSYYRTFSISSIPSTGSSLTLTIKKIKGGKVTNYLAEKLKVGESLEVSPPSGHFYVNPEPSHQKNYLMIAGGSGITPIFSMIGGILKVEPKSRIKLLYANRNSKSIIFKEKIENWLIQYPNQIEVVFFLTEEANIENSVKGRLAKESIGEFLPKSRDESFEIYLCGPEMMTQSLEKAFIDFGVAKDKIHKELFVISQPKNSAESSVSAKITAKVLGKVYQFDVENNKTILQTALEKNFPLPHACQSGLCGTCIMKCTEGKVEMKNSEALSNREKEKGYILTCQAIPLTEIVKIVTE